MAFARVYSVYFIVAVVLSAALPLLADEDPKLKQCLQKCRRQEQYGERQKYMCEKQCEESYGRERRHGSQSEEREESPYVFEERFRIIVETGEGRFGLLERFTERTSLLKGIENYRIAFLEANPHAFVIPFHCDADTVFFVGHGRATIKLIERNKLETVEVGQGDILRVDAGTTVYIVNPDPRENLCMVKFLKAASVPGQVEAFFGAGGENPESFYRAFDEDLLAAALNTKKDVVRNLLGRQKQGAILKASEEQIKSLAGGGGGGIWPFGSDSRRSFNLLKKKPLKCNEHGSLHEADCDDYDQLRDLDMAISYANITQGSMAGPFYNSRATKIALVARGKGYLEIACPHLSQEEEEEKKRSRGPTYKAISSQLRPGVVFVVPAGHPFAVVASGSRGSQASSENLEIVFFNVNQNGNVRYALAGKHNVIAQIEASAKELAFNAPSREVDEMFQSQPEEYFFKGPEGWRQPGIRAYA